MINDEAMVVREEARYWWVLLVAGFAWLLIAWLVLRMNQTSLATVGVLLGVVFIMAGVTKRRWLRSSPEVGRFGTMSWPSSSFWAACGA